MDLLQSRATAVGGDPLWLGDPSLCTEREDLLDEAVDVYGDSHFYDAAAVGKHACDRVSDEQAACDSNGCWLRSLDGQAYENVPAVAESAGSQCRVRTTGDTIVAPVGRVVSWS